MGTPEIVTVTPILVSSRLWNEERVVQLLKVFQSRLLGRAIVVIQDEEEPGIDGKPIGEQPPNSHLLTAKGAKKASDHGDVRQLFSIVKGEAKAHMYTVGRGKPLHRGPRSTNKEFRCVHACWGQRTPAGFTCLESLCLEQELRTIAGGQSTSQIALLPHNASHATHD